MKFTNNNSFPRWMGCWTIQRHEGVFTESCRRLRLLSCFSLSIVVSCVCRSAFSAACRTARMEFLEQCENKCHNKMEKTFEGEQLFSPVWIHCSEWLKLGVNPGKLSSVQEARKYGLGYDSTHTKLTDLIQLLQSLFHNLHCGRINLIRKTDGAAYFAGAKNSVPNRNEVASADPGKLNQNHMWSCLLEATSRAGYTARYE